MYLIDRVEPSCSLLFENGGETRDGKRDVKRELDKWMEDCKCCRIKGNNFMLCSSNQISICP